MTGDSIVYQIDGAQVAVGCVMVPRLATGRTSVSTRLQVNIPVGLVTLAVPSFMTTDGESCTILPNLSKLLMRSRS